MIDSELTERRLLAVEAGDVVPVLVRGDHEVQVPVRGGLDVGDDLRHRDPAGLRAERPAVDQHMPLVPTDVEREQVAVAESLPVHAHTDPRRRCGR